MRGSGMTVAVAMWWLAGVVGAASLPPDDQYSPQQSPYRRDDAARGPRGFPNWLEYEHREPSAGLEPPENKPGTSSLRAGDLSRDRKTRKDSMTRDVDFQSLAPGGWSVGASRSMRNFTGPRHPDLDLPEEGLEMVSDSREDPYGAEDTFQDQGPGSVEVYKLDLRRENSLLVPLAKRKQPQSVAARIKSKIPKKAKGDEILWKLKPIETGRTSLPVIFRQPPNVPRGSAMASRESRRKIEEKRKETEVFAVGGVPELQVGCEGLEASDRRKRRASGSAEEDNDEDEFWPRIKDPVYRESTEPILLRVTPVVLDLEDETPAGKLYEELDELLKLKRPTTPEPKRRNRGDIDPILENYHRGEDLLEKTLPERGDLGPYRNKENGKVEGSIRKEKSQDDKVEGARFPRESNGKVEGLLNVGVGGEDDEALPPIVESPSEMSCRHGGRKLLWVQYPESQENRRRTRRHQGAKVDEDLWGFGEDDGGLLDARDESEAERLRKLEEEKRRREYERRRQEELEKIRADRERSSKDDRVQSEIERIRKEYERQQEEEQGERQRLVEERRRQMERKQWEDDRRRAEEARRRQSEESRRRVEEEERRNREPSDSRRREEEERRREWSRRRDEEERRIRLESERNNQAPPSHLTRPSTHTRPDNRSRSHQEEERRKAEERKLQEYIERNRPINLKKSEERRGPEDQTKRRNDDEERRKHIEAQRRRQVEEERRRQAEEEERRRQIEEQRRRLRPVEDRAREEEKRRRLEEERKLQEYVRRNQPINAPRRNSSQERDWQEQRRTIDEARRWEYNNQHIPKDGRSHGPSAPTNIGHRQSEGYLEELRRRQEAERLEAERRRFVEEGRRREEAYRREESRRHEEERRRLEAARRNEEANRRRTNWQDSRRPTNTTHRTEVRDREAEELRRHENTHRLPENSRRNQEDEVRRRHEERERQRQLQQQREERERLRTEQERNDRNNGRPRPHHQDTGLSEQRRRDESVRSRDEAERRRREEARLRALPVSARIIVRSDEIPPPPRAGGNLRNATQRPPSISIGTRAGFGNEIDFPRISPDRPGIPVGVFPAPGTLQPPTRSPSACVWAIVNCCPANRRLTSCFESMGCPGANWDVDPCRSSVQSAAQAEVLKFYDTAEDNYTRG